MQLPEEFCARMRHFLGDEAEELFSAFDRERFRALRMNPLKKTGNESAWPETLRKVPWAEDGRYFAEDGQGRHPYHAAGAYYIQEPSAMAPAELLAGAGKTLSGSENLDREKKTESAGEDSPLAGLRVLDLCAAPGGKTTQLAGKMAGRGVLVSNEVMPDRAKILSQNVERMGIRNAFVVSAEVEKIAETFPGWFDRVMVDAPCSGEGMFRKEEAALSGWSMDNIFRCAERQDRILSAAAECVAPGGYLLYSTCTFAPEEDEGSAARFLAAHPEFHAVPVPKTGGMADGHPEWADGNPELLFAARFWPHRADGEGHFMILFRKDGERRENRDAEPERGRLSAAGRKSRRTGGAKVAGDAAEARKLWNQFCEEVLIEPEKFQDPDRLYFRKDRLWYLPEEGAEVLHRLSRGGITHVLRSGLELGDIARGRFVPAHAFAMAMRREEVKHAFDFPADSEEIRAYLHGESIRAETGDARGWAVVFTDGYSCGFAKASGGILKNHYPKGLRTKY